MNNIKSEVTIRKMDMSDVPFVYQSEMETFGKSLSKRTLYDELLYNELAHYFILLVGKERIGYVGIWITEPNAEILNIFVLKNYQRQGFGQQLINHVFKLCNDHQVQHLTLEVRASNQQAIGFYEYLGFKVATLRKQYYQDGENAILMVKEIGGMS